MPTTPYRLGLTMAGAVSAGAYTSGMLTQLFEALDLWYKLRSGQIPEAEHNVQLFTPDEKEVVTLALEDLPRHEVLITAISGTSAGGMCSALLPIAFAEDNLDRLRKTWVDDVDLKQMLDINDLDEHNRNLLSLLNVSGIDAIRDAAKTFTPDPEVAQGKKWPAYLSEAIDIYLNFTNLEGIPYRLKYNEDRNAKSQIIRTYADYKRYTFLKPGTDPSRVPADSTALNPASKTQQGINYEWDGLMEAAVASGAFPFGLRPRTLTREKREYEHREFFLRSQNPADGSFPFPIKMAPSWPAGSPPTFLMEYVDGGLTNNEPFEQARRAVARAINKNRNPREGELATAGVLLVDPFPSDPIGIPGEAIAEIPNLLSLLPLIISVMKDNAQFDLDLLDSIQNPEIYSRFMVAPVRTDETTGKPYKHTLASSSLGAFAGFFSIKFRDHDFRLARYNTSRFLEYHFALPVANKLIFGDLANDTRRLELYRKLGWVFNNDHQGNVVPEGTPGSVVHMSLVPQFRFANRTFNSYYNVAPQWPKLPKDELDDLKVLGFKRFKKLRYTVIDHMTGDGFLDGAKDGLIDTALSAFIGEKKFNQLWQALVETPFRDAGLVK